MQAVTRDGKYGQFHRASAEKRERILHAALEEFADKEYAQASTNAIVARADISKGLLFHYFGDKAGLFRYLLAHVTEALTEDIFTQTNMQGSDVFDVLHKIIQAKLQTTANHPLEVRFYARALTSDLPPKVRDVLENAISQSYDSLNLISDHLDARLLKEGLDKKQVVKIIKWVSEGMTNEILASLDPTSNIDEYSQVYGLAEDYFGLLRWLLYKKINNKGEEVFV
ncbi:MAG: TetR/AcrR family transcriptional regulator [Coriobacteriales bacterium]|jgi:AcrR family transcriptional regulator|nr:TetR/AcrR family transcriptional regulator [Coriobacteriales bacterium]